MEEDDIVIRVGSSLRIRGDKLIRREGLQARGIYKEVPRPSRRLGLATRQKIPYNYIVVKEYRTIYKAYKEGGTIGIGK